MREALQDFTELYFQLEHSRTPREKLHRLRNYFRQAENENAVWTMELLIGPPRTQIVAPAQLLALAQVVMLQPPWLVAECDRVVEDTAELISLLLSSTVADSNPDLVLAQLSLFQWIKEVHSLRAATEDIRSEKILHWWRSLTPHEILVLNKILLGDFRIDITDGVVAQALADVWQRPSNEIFQRLQQPWKPTLEFFASLVHAKKSASQADSQASNVDPSPETKPVSKRRRKPKRESSDPQLDLPLDETG